MEETALGIVSVVNEHMASAIRMISVNRGHDPKEFILASFGGAGGLHVCALADAMQSISGAGWKLGDAVLKQLWSQPIDDAEIPTAELSRRAKRRIRRALRGFDPLALRDLDPELWREELLAQATALAVRDGKLSLRDGLLELLALWPSSKHLDLRSGGDLAAAVQLCPPARSVLLRLADAAIDGIGLS